MSHHTQDVTYAIGKRIRETRKSLNLRQADLADAVGISNSHLSDIERGLMIPTIPTLQKISRALDRPIEYFFAENIEVPRSLGMAIHRSLIGEKATLKLAQLVNEKTSGELKIHIYQNAIPGNVYHIVEGLAQGSIHLFLDDLLSFEHYANLCGMVFLPYFFQDRAQYHRFLQSNLFNERIAQPLLQNGIRLLNAGASWEAGSYELLFATDPIFTPDELKNRKFRSYGSEIADALRTALGARAVRVVWKESHDAFQQGIIDTFLLPAAYLSSLKLHEVTRYATYLDYGYTQNLVIAISEQEYRKLSPPLQQALDESIQETGIYFTHMMHDHTHTALEQLTHAHNIPVIHPDPSAWRARFDEAIRQVALNIITPDLYEQLVHV